MCAEEGMLPADVITAVCERARLCSRRSRLLPRDDRARTSALMRLALERGRCWPQATADVPVGAVVVDADGEVLGRGHNAREATGDPTAHAEVLALRAAAAALGHVAACGLHARRHARALHDVRRRAACWRGSTGSSTAPSDPKAGAVGSLWDVVRDRRLNHRPEVVSGVLAEECGALLAGLFRGTRPPRLR